MKNHTAADYLAACKRAATAQGLDTLTDALAAAGIDHGVAQTGGFCMVVTAHTNDGTLVAIHDAPEPTPWLLGFFPGTAFETGEGESSVDYDPCDLTTAVQHFADHTAKGA